jgi:hypothetical protein
LAQKPAKGGTPEIASAPMPNIHEVIGMNRHRPPILVMSVSPSRPCITEPADRNMSAL